MALGIKEIEVSVVIPCLNEEETIAGCIEKAKSAISESGIVGEVVVVDNGSTDSSPEISKKLGARVVTEKRHGYGRALSRGFSEARGKYIVFADADESYDFGYTVRFVNELRKGAELVMGSRFRGKIEKGAMPFLHRFLGTPVLTFMLRLFFRARITDVNCGMRGLTKEAIAKLKLTCTGMEFASEMVVKAAKLGMKITEIPIDFKKDKRSSRPHLRTFIDGWRHLRFILLFAPKWMFLFPGMLAFLLGFLFMSIILFSEAKYFGIFSMLICQSLIFLGAQFILYGVSSCGFSQFLRFHREEDRLYRIFKNFTIEKGIVLGMVLFVIGLVISVLAGIDIYNYMMTTDEFIFKADATKWGFFGISLLILGFQLVFSSFYICLFNIKIYEND
jgi:glycosyltransferase involved in cell wall biosynthesis